MGNTNQKKGEQLGMPFGTAMHKLRKSITFHLLQKLGENICYVCKETIDTVDELSYEHKVPWEGIDPELFWDLDNIAFSHLWCNRPHRRGAHQLRKIGPEGTAWCCGCQQFKDTSLFNKAKNYCNGYDTSCKACRAKWRAENKKKAMLLQIEKSDTQIT